MKGRNKMIKDIDYKIHYSNFNELKVKGVYLIRNLDNKKLKIGITDNLPRRFKQINNSFSFCGVNTNLKIECYIEYEYNLELERYLHKNFEEFNYKNEWFSIENIEIILNKLDDFTKIIPFEFKKQTIEIKEEVAKSHICSNKENKSLIDKYIKYYHSEYNRETEDYNSKVLYIKTNREWFMSILTDIQKKILDYDDYYSNEICNGVNENRIKKSKLNKEVLRLFDNGSKVVIEISKNKYMDFEKYLFKKYKETFLLEYNHIKEDIISELNNPLFRDTENIDEMCKDKEYIDDKLLHIQEQINTLINERRRKDFRSQYYKTPWN